MAKKTTRPNIPQDTLERARRQMANAPDAPIVASEAPPSSVAAVPKARTQLSSADLSTEYAYVVNDLQSMAILATAFLGVLIALAFII